MVCGREGEATSEFEFGASVRGVHKPLSVFLASSGVRRLHVRPLGPVEGARGDVAERHAELEGTFVITFGGKAFITNRHFQNVFSRRMQNARAKKQTN